MRRLLVLVLVVVGCDDFDALEAAALDAGRVAAGGAAGGGSGGATGGGASGGMSGGGATGGGSAGGTTGGGVAGGTTGGGSAGGTTGGGVAGGTTGGGSAGGTTGGGVAGGGVAGGGVAGGTTGGGSAGGDDGGLRTVRTSAARYLAVAASPTNGQLAIVEANDGGGVVVFTVNGNPLYAQGALSDLDARFGMVVVTTTEGVWWLDLQGVWWRVGGTPASVGLSTPIFRAPAEQHPRLASYWRSDAGVALYSSTGLPLDGGAPPQVSLVDAGLPSPLAFRVRPDESGSSGVIVGSRNEELCGTQFVATFARIGSFSPMVQGGSVTACDMLVASSEDQHALLVWRAVDAGLGGRIRTAFWQPRGSTTLPTEPDHWLDSNNGFLPIEAIATDGARHAAIVYQPARSTVTVPDAGISIDGGHLLIMVGGANRPRLIDLGAASPPFGVAFGSDRGSAGLFVLANCPATTLDAGAPLCTGLAGGVVTFMPSEF